MRRYQVMRLSHSTRKTLAGCCFFLSSVWGAAGAFKLIFGIRITFVLLPPLDLERVSPVSALATALGFIVLGAWLGRTSDAPINTSDFEPEESPAELLNADSGLVSRAPVARATTPIGTRPRS